MKPQAASLKQKWVGYTDLISSHLCTTPFPNLWSLILTDAEDSDSTWGNVIRLTAVPATRVTRSFIHLLFTYANQLFKTCEQTFNMQNSWHLPLNASIRHAVSLIDKLPYYHEHERSHALVYCAILEFHRLTEGQKYGQSALTILLSVAVCSDARDVKTFDIPEKPKQQHSKHT